MVESEGSFQLLGNDGGGGILEFRGGGGSELKNVRSVKLLGEGQGGGSRG